MPVIHFSDDEFEQLRSFYTAELEAVSKYIERIKKILAKLETPEKSKVVKPEQSTGIAAKPAKKRGRPKKVRIEIINKRALTKPGSKRRGRPPKVKSELPIPAVTGDGLKELISQKIVEPLVLQAKQAKKSGRPPRVKTAEPRVAATHSGSQPQIVPSMRLEDDFIARTAQVDPNARKNQKRRRRSHYRR